MSDNCHFCNDSLEVKKADIFRCRLFTLGLKKFQIFYVLTGYMSNNGAALMTEATSIKIGAT